eukprot:2228862-Ditylum_brightwellii.AAC.1
MDKFESYKPSTGTLEKLNVVRLYLQVLTLADIVDGHGCHIDPWALSGSKQAKVLIPWPSPEKPQESSWFLWR